MDQFTREASLAPTEKRLTRKVRFGAERATLELASFYGVPVSEILPGDDGPPAPGQVEGRRRVVLDLEGLDKVPESDRDPLARFTHAIQIQRGDYNGRVLTIREDDLMALALLYQTTADELSKRLAEWGLLAKSA